MLTNKATHEKWDWSKKDIFPSSNITYSACILTLSNSFQFILINHKGCFTCIFFKYFIYYCMKLPVFEISSFCFCQLLLYHKSLTPRKKDFHVCVADVWAKEGPDLPSFPKGIVTHVLGARQGLLEHLE